MEGWKFDDAGDIVIFPLTGWQSAMSSEVGVALRLDFLRSQAELRAALPSSEQFVLNAKRAIELGEELARLGRAAIAGRSRK